MAVAEEDSMSRSVTEHYPKLIDVLPVETLMAKFVSAKIVKFEEQDAILMAARRFLPFVTVPLESSKKTHTFRSMLKVVDKHGGADNSSTSVQGTFLSFIVCACYCVRYPKG